MKFNFNNKRCRIGVFCLSMVLFFVSAFPVCATNIKDLENQSSNLESELSALEKEIDDILKKINKKSSELKETREELAITKGNEQAQYESMMIRIKYMYENGNTNYLEILLESNGLVEFVSNAEYISQISKYDRKLLNDFASLREEIAEKEEQLESDQKYLQSLQAELDKKEENLTKELASCKDELKKAKDAAAKAAAEAAKPVKPVVPNNGSSSSGSTSGSSTNTDTSIRYEASDVELLAALLECEAGSTNYEGLLAVGSVVVNRMKHYKYPNTLQGVIFQRGQFPPATNGKLDRILARGVKPLCVQAAQDALNGKNNVGDCLSFRSASSGHAGTIIGSNVFF